MANFIYPNTSGGGGGGSINGTVSAGIVPYGTAADTIGNTNIFYSAGSGSLGINVVSPTYPLQVGEPGQPLQFWFSPQLSTIGCNDSGYGIALTGGVPGAANAGGTIFLGGGNRGDASRNVIAFAYNGIEVGRFGGLGYEGNFGIGTTTPSARLEVRGASSSPSTPIAVLSSSGPQCPLYFQSGAASSYIKGDSGGNFAMGAQGFIAYEAGGFGATFERMRVTASGYVGIGTSGPGRPLNVVSTSVGESGFYTIANFDNDTAYNASPISGLGFGNKYTSGGAYAGMGGISVGKANATDGDFSSYLALYTRPAGVGITERLRIDSAGNVGIGTQTPGSRLAVIGLPVYADNASAITGGLAAGDFYRTGADPDLVCVVH